MKQAGVKITINEIKPMSTAINVQCIYALLKGIYIYIYIFSSSNSIKLIYFGIKNQVYVKMMSKFVHYSSVLPKM